MITEKNPFFNLEDLQNIEIRVEGVNITSQIPMGINGDSIQLLQVLPEGAYFEVSPRSCAMGHTLDLDLYIQIKTGDKPELIHIQSSGVIEEIEGLPAERKQIKIRFRKVDTKKWESILDYYQNKQDSMNEMLRNTRS